MKIQKKHLSAATAMALMLTMTISIMALPGAVGQTGDIGRDKIVMSAATAVVPNPVGVGQPVWILGNIYPTPIVPGDIYSGLNFTITAPNGTKYETIHDSDTAGEYNFQFVPDVAGTWNLRLYWPGDEYHTEVNPSAMFSSASRNFVVQNESVQIPGKRDSFCYVATSPRDRVQLGKTIYIIGFIVPPRELSGGLHPDITFTIKKPNGQTDTEFFYYTNSEASRSFNYLPDQLGEYSVTMSYPGTVFWNGDTSDPWTFTVQEEGIPPYWTSPPIPERWGYPIMAQNGDWWLYSGVWDKASILGGYYHWNAFTKAPTTPHVLYRIPTSEGGLIGGPFGAYGSSPGGRVTIEGKSSPFIAGHGRMYYTMPFSEGGIDSHAELFCRNLQTGELIFQKRLPGNGTPTTLWMEYDALVKVDPKTGVEVAGTACLWAQGTSTWQIDLLNGNTLYYIDRRTGTYRDHAIYFNNWNGTSNRAETGTMTKWDTRTKAVVWTKKGITGTTVTDDGFIFQTFGDVLSGTGLRSWNSTTGEKLAEGPLYPFRSSDTNCWGYGKWYVHATDRKVYAIDLATGLKAWESEPHEAPWGVWASYGASCGDGLVFFDSHDGYERGYDVNTGEVKFEVFTEYTDQTAMGVWGTWSQTILGDGKVWFACGEHSPPNPIPAGGPLICADMATGEKLWTIHGFYNKAGVQQYGFLCDGVLAYANLVDGQLWFFGRGESATTISGPATVALGGSVTLEGSITDQSTGITAYGTPVKGTACVSDASMPQWTEYLYMGEPQPTNATGVPVWLFAMTEDGNIVDITHVTTDVNGHYAYTWTPPEQMTYKVFASFEGTGGYYPSMAQSAVGVTAAPEAPAGPEAAPDTTNLQYGILGGVIAAIVIGLAALFVGLRKK